MLKTTKQSDIQRQWHLINAQDQILGRITTQIAILLMGKNKPYFVRNLDCGDYVVVINAKAVKVTGKKETQKQYGQYSGYPGGLKLKSLKQVSAENPTRIIRKAVKGMLPQNKLGDRMITRLYAYADDKYPYEEKFKK